jgi:uncharacterized protein (TIGR00369 family)
MSDADGDSLRGGTMGEPPDPGRDGWRERKAAGFMGHAGPLWTRREPDGWGYGFLAERRHANNAGVVHGGMLVTLVDHAIATVAWEENGRKPCLTITLDTQFIAAAKPGAFVEARARVSGRTSSLMFMQGMVTVAGATVLTASAVIRLFAAPRSTIDGA